LYLTFDDGPIPDVTEEILNILQSYDVKATFFCVGANVERYPSIFEKIKAGGHQTGNHTFHHLKGWKTPIESYLNDIDRCNQLVPSRLFRPPYGRGTKAQYNRLKNFEIIMWDVLSGDFDPSLRPEKCLQNVLKHTQNGSIIVF